MLAISSLGSTDVLSAQASPDLVPMPATIAEAYRTTQADPALSDEEKIKATIDAYFNVGYLERQQGRGVDFASVISAQTADKSWLQSERDRRDILIAQTALRLKFVSFAYTLTYSSIQIEKEFATATLAESHEVVFEVSSPEVSKMAGLVHEVRLHRDVDGWRLVADKYQDELSQLMATTPKSQILAAIEHERQVMLRGSSSSTVQASHARLLPALSVHGYNRSAAASYADTWWNTANSAFNYYAGNNCTNYTSQAVYMGSNQTQSSGSGANDWHFKPDTGPWIRVAEFNTWINTNTGRGPYGVGTSQCDVAVGDVIQLQQYGYDWYHGVIVVAITAPRAEQCINKGVILIDSNTINRWHYPLSSYAGVTQYRWIKIAGWRD